MTTRTERLGLRRPTLEDVGVLFDISSDPRLWTHFPILRHTDVSQTQAMVEKWIVSWDRSGLGTWAVEEREKNTVIGYGGCTAVKDTYWNLGYRLAFSAQGHGFATELSCEAIKQAILVRPELPVVAYLLEHNLASAKVAQKVGLALVHSGPDAGNPDPAAIRLVYANRQLTDTELEIVME